MIITARLLNNKGQALLLVVLIMVVALTVTLSLVSRSVVNLKTSVEQTNSQKALSAAEAGVEQAIKNNVSIGSSSPIDLGQAQYSANVTQVSDNNNSGVLVNGGNIVSKDEGANVWLAGYNEVNSADGNAVLQSIWPSKNATSSNIYLFWGDKSGDDKNAAIEVALIKGTSKNESLIERFAFDPSSARAGSNHFDYSSVTKGSPNPYLVNGKNFTYRVQITISQGILMRVNPIYYSTYMAVQKKNSNDPALPTQGSIITSSGCSPRCSDTSAVQRKITVFQGYPAGLFPYSILSP